MSDHLPQDLVVEILARLPVKSLLRFRGVSNVWCSSISSSKFISDHIKKSIDNVDNHRQDLLGCSRNMFFLLNTKNQEIKECSFDYRKDYSGYDFCIVGSCRGLVCLHDSHANKHVLWNPSIRKYMEIPQSGFILSGSRPQILGFGFDPFSNDYKLVSGVYNIDPDKYEGTIEVYSLKSRSWRIVTSPPRIRHVILKHSVFLNGSCHWIVYGYSNNNSVPNVTKFILTFDVRQEVFGRIAAVPAAMHEQNIMASSDGLLSLASWTKHSVNVEIWAMKEYGVAESWTKILRIEHPQWGMRNVVGFWRNEVLFSNVGGKLVCYDLKTKSKRDCKMYGEPHYTFWGDSYFNSLVLLDQLQVNSGGLHSTPLQKQI